MIKVPKQIQRVGLLVGFLVFVTGSFFSLRELDGLTAELRWQIFAPLLLTIPLATHLAIRRFETLSSAVDVRTGYATAASIVVWGAVANLLPVPGAFMVRLAYLADKVGLRRSGLLNIASLFTWFLAASLVACVLCFPSYPGLALALLLLALLLAGSLVIFLRLSAARPMAALRLLLIQLTLTTLNVLRMVLIALFLQVWLPLPAASLMALTGVAASAVGVFPAGMGLTESLAALVSWALELQLALGFAVAAINRVCGWLGLLIYIPWLTGLKDARHEVSS